MTRLGSRMGGVAAAALGVFILLWGDFATPWENVPAGPPLRGVLVFGTGAVLVAAGAGLFWHRTARPAALALAAICACFTLFWVLAAARTPLIYDPWGNIAEQSSVVAGFLAIYASLAPRKTTNMARLALGARIWFGICSLSFGAVHFISLKPCADFVPKWMPFGGLFWAAFVGVAHLAVAVAILSGVWAVLAARLAALMYLGLAVVAWGNLLLQHPKDHFSLGGAIVTLTLVAAAWMLGDSIAAFPPKDGALFLPERHDAVPDALNAKTAEIR